MKLINKKALAAFIEKHADARRWINNWVADIEGARWTTPQDIKRRYPSASFLAENVVVFNVKGNSYRLEVQVAFVNGVVLVRWVGTHAEYSRR